MNSNINPPAENQKKKRQTRSREVSQIQTLQYLKRPIKKLENLDQNLQKSYQSRGLRKRSFKSFINSNSMAPEQSKQTQKQKKQSSSQSSITTSNQQQDENIQKTKNLELNGEMQIQQNKEQLLQQNYAREQKFHQQQAQQNQEQEQQSANDDKSQKQEYQPEQSSDSSESSQSQKVVSQKNSSGTAQSGKRKKKRDRDQMILAYKIQDLRYMINGKKKMPMKNRARKVIGPAPTKQEVWQREMKKYQKLVMTVQRQIDYKAILLKKIVSIGTLKRQNKVSNNKKVSKKRQNKTFDSSSAQSSSYSPSKQDYLNEIMKNTLKQFDIDSDADIQSGDQICVSKLNEIVTLKHEINTNIELLQQRPYHFFGRKQGRKRLSAKERQKRQQENSNFSLNQQNSRKSNSKNKNYLLQNENKSLNHLPQRQQRNILRTNLRPRRIQAYNKLQTQTFLKQNKIHKQQMAQQNLQQKRRRLTFQSRIIAESLFIRVQSKQKQMKVDIPEKQEVRIEADQIITKSQWEKSKFFRKPIQNEQRISQIDHAQQRQQQQEPVYEQLRRKKHRKYQQDYNSSDQQQKYRIFKEFNQYMKYAHRKPPKYKKYKTYSASLPTYEEPKERRIIRKIKRGKVPLDQIKIQDSQIQMAPYQYYRKRKNHGKRQYYQRYERQ